MLYIQLHPLHRTRPYLAVRYRPNQRFVITETVITKSKFYCSYIKIVPVDRLDFLRRQILSRNRGSDRSKSVVSAVKLKAQNLSLVRRIQLKPNAAFLFFDNHRIALFMRFFALCFLVSLLLPLTSIRLLLPRPTSDRRPFLVRDAAARLSALG